jgi:hypothetical protein
MDQWEFAFGKLRLIGLRILVIHCLQSSKGRSCEIYVDVDLHLISVKCLSEFVEIVGGGVDVLKLMLCKTKIGYRKTPERLDPNISINYSCLGFGFDRQYAFII